MFVAKVFDLSKNRCLSAVIAVAVMFFLLEACLSITTTFENDEGTHSLIGLFYEDLVPFAVSHPSIGQVYSHAITYLIHFPKISIYNQPIIHLIYAALFAAFGDSYILARLVSAAFGAALIVVVYRLALLVFGREKPALIAALITATSPLVIFMGRAALLDLPLAFFFALSIYLYLLASKTGLWKHYAYASVALFFCLMTKLWFAGLLPLSLIVNWLFDRKNGKKIFVSLLVVALAMTPYIAIALKYGFLLLPITESRGAAWQGLNESDPQFTTVQGWLYYPISFAVRFLVFPLVLFAFAGMWLFYKDGVGHWKLFATIMLVSYAAITVYTNKDARYAGVLLAPLALYASYSLEKLVNRYGSMGVVVLVSLLIINVSFAFAPANLIHFGHAYDEEVADFVLSNPGNVYLASDTANVYSSNFMFFVASSDRNIIVARPCVLQDNMSASKDVLSGINARWVIYDTADTDSRSKNVIGNLKELSLIKIKDKMGPIEIYSHTGYDELKVAEECNYVCLTEEKMCVSG